MEETIAGLDQVRAKVSSQRLYITPVATRGAYHESPMVFYLASEFDPMAAPGLIYRDPTFDAESMYAFFFIGKGWRWASSGLFGGENWLRRRLLMGLFRVILFFRKAAEALRRARKSHEALRRARKSQLNVKTVLSLVPLYYGLLHPVLAEEVGREFRVSVRGHLVLSDPEDIVEDYELSPSQSYLKACYEAKILHNLQAPLRDEDLEPWEAGEGVYPSDRESAERFLAWRKRLEANGREITFIAELDT